MKSNLRYFRFASFVLLSTILSLLYIFQPPILRKFSAGIEDSKFAVRSILNFSPSHHRDLVVVAVDEKSVNKIGRWPWNRKVIGDLIGRLAEANLVALDIIFSERLTVEEDEYLAERIADNDNVILGFFFRTVASETVSEEALSYLEECALVRYKLLGDKIGLPEFRYAEVNIPEVSSGALSCASFNTIPDVDGLFRNYPLAFIYGGYIFPSLGMQTLRHFLNKDIEVELDEGGINKFKLGDLILEDTNNLRLNYYEDVEQVSAYDVLNGRIDSSYFKDKIVIIGITETGIYDLRPTPVDPVTPGVYLHFTAVSNILNDELLKTSGILDLSLIFLTLVLAAIFSTLGKISSRLLLYLSLLFLIIIAVNFMFIAHNFWINLTLPLLGLVLFSATSEIFVYAKTEAHAAEIRKAFSSYVSPEIVKNIIKDPDSLKLGGEEREVTILFSDIRDFTTISEKLTPDRLVHMLNSLLDPLTECILKNKGLLDKYIGDAIMSIFNAPISIDNHADMACVSALEMMKKVGEVNEMFEREDIPNIDIGIGIHTGTATVGNMGSKVRFDYTAVGDTVNLASRIEGLSKTYKANVIISEATKKMLKGELLLRKLDRVKVKGRDIPLTIFELMDENENNRRIKMKFEEGMEVYFRKDFEKAKEIFETLYKDLADKTSYLFYERCLYYTTHSLPDDWDGVHEHKTK